jgi:hypothetical protein
LIEDQYFTTRAKSAKSEREVGASVKMATPEPVLLLKTYPEK